MPWREEHLGSPRDQPLLPVLIRLRDLVQELRDPQAAREPSDRGWLLRILATRTRPADVDDDRGRDERRQQWDRWLERGEALLLLDGLDEVSDLDLRDKVKAIVRSACETWPQCRIVITSRPLLIDALTAPPLRFHHEPIGDFGPKEVERFVSQWSAALFARSPGRGAANTRSLLSALAERPDLREFATNPVLGPMRAYTYREDPGLIARRKQLAARVMAIFTHAGAREVPVKLRIAAAEVIGCWGDPRLADDNFIEIPGTGLRLGRYPVTVVEDARFIAAGGYGERWWDAGGWGEAASAFVWLYRGPDVSGALGGRDLENARVALVELVLSVIGGNSPAAAAGEHLAGIQAHADRLKRPGSAHRFEAAGRVPVVPHDPAPIRSVVLLEAKE